MKYKNINTENIKRLIRRRVPRSSKSIVGSLGIGWPACPACWQAGGKAGFSLIEFIIVLGVIAILLPAIFTLYLVSIQNQQKAQIIVSVKQNGDNALSTMENLIHNRATGIFEPTDTVAEQCASSGASHVFSNGISFKDKQGDFFTLSLDSSDILSKKISSGSALINTKLTSDKVSVTALSFSCSRPSAFSLPIVAVSFTITERGGPKRHENKQSLDWATNIKLRN